MRRMRDFGGDGRQENLNKEDEEIRKQDEVIGKVAERLKAMTTRQVLRIHHRIVPRLQRSNLLLPNWGAWTAPQSTYYDDEDCDLDKHEEAYEPPNKCKETALDEIVDFLEDRSRAQIRKYQARFRITKMVPYFGKRDATIAEKVLEALKKWSDGDLFGQMLAEMDKGTQVDFS